MRCIFYFIELVQDHKGFALYMDCCINLSSIENVSLRYIYLEVPIHVVSDRYYCCRKWRIPSKHVPRFRLYLPDTYAKALKMIEFLDHYGASLYDDDLEAGYDAWTSFLTTHDFEGDPVRENTISPKIRYYHPINSFLCNYLYMHLRSVTLLYPSLPPLTGLSRIMSWMAKPYSYTYKKRRVLSNCNPTFLVKHLYGDDANEELDVSPAQSWESGEVCTSIIGSHVTC
jgi:hypothetical protein